MLKITYLCVQGPSFNEFICPEHTGFARYRAHEWWKQRFTSEPPASTREWLQYVHHAAIPKRVRVHVNKKYPEVLRYEF